MIFNKRTYPHYYEFVMLGEIKTYEGRKYGEDNSEILNDEYVKLLQLERYRYEELGGDKDIHMPEV